MSLCLLSGLQLSKIALWVCFGFCWFFWWFFLSCVFDLVTVLVSNSLFPQLDLCSCSPYTYLGAITCFFGVLNIITFPREKHMCYKGCLELLWYVHFSVSCCCQCADACWQCSLCKYVLIWNQLHLLFWVVALCGLPSSLETWFVEGIINTINVLSTVLTHSQSHSCLNWIFLRHKYCSSCVKRGELINMRYNLKRWALWSQEYVVLRDYTRVASPNCFQKSNLAFSCQ